MIEELDAFIGLGIGIAVLILALGLFAWQNHDHTHRKLDELQNELHGGMESLHNRADREIAERTWSLQGIRAAIEMLRTQVIALFRGDK